MPVAMIILGLVLLVAGGHALVRGASSLARTFGISPLIIGLTVVSIGTSAPELAVCLKAAFRGSGDVALGNVLGSNICNILLVLGLGAAVRNLVVERQLVRLDVPIMIGISGLALLLGRDGSLSGFDGILLLLGAVAYTVLQIHLSRRENGNSQAQILEQATSKQNPPRKWGSWVGQLTLVFLGLALLIIGADWLVGGAVTLARAAGISELVIGITIIAVGTSLPEVTATLIAIFRKETAMAVGNLVGSNVYNLLLVLGATSAFSPGGVGIPLSALRFDFPIMVVVAIACLPIFTTGHRIARWEGWLFFFYFLLYMGYQFLRSTRSEFRDEFQVGFWGFILPLTVITLGVSLHRHLRERAKRRAAGTGKSMGTG